MQINSATPDLTAISRPMTTQEYEATFDKNYVADQYHTWDQLLWQNDSMWQKDYDELQCEVE